ncbi:MAG: hypothetical protein Q8O88_00990 [bacterium]|nr:hypothetical protein [bacterium]
MNKKQIKKILLYVGSVDPWDNTYWGHDTEMGNIDELVDYIYGELK